MSRQSDIDNHANQLNPNNEAYWSSRGEDERPDDWDERVEDNQPAQNAAGKGGSGKA